MLRTLDLSMLGLTCSIREIAPIAAKYGFQAVSATQEVFQNKTAAKETAAVLSDNGLSWGLMPMPADFYHWNLDDSAFEEALEHLRHLADTARVLGVSHAYNHVWPCSSRSFDENFSWTVKRIRAVNSILRGNGIAYGLEFLGPHELRAMAEHEFIHSLSGALALADAAGGGVGIAFDVFHWYSSSNGAMDDVILMDQNIQRLVAVHISDAVQRRPFYQQKDMDRRLPGETGVIDVKNLLSRFGKHHSSALYMAEPFMPVPLMFSHYAWYCIACPLAISQAEITLLPPAFKSAASVNLHFLILQITCFVLSQVLFFQRCNLEFIALTLPLQAFQSSPPQHPL